MSSTNKTVNYKLSQFIGTDKPTFLGDYNNDMQIIDGAIFEANQSAEQALNDVEAVKGAQAELKNVHAETREQVAQLKETADGMTGDVTAAQEAANSAEQKATEAQTVATGVLNAANAASANATKAKQTADGNKTTLAELTQRVKALEGVPKVQPIVLDYKFAQADSNQYADILVPLNGRKTLEVDMTEFPSGRVFVYINGVITSGGSDNRKEITSTGKTAYNLTGEYAAMQIGYSSGAKFQLTIK